MNKSLGFFLIARVVRELGVAAFWAGRGRELDMLCFGGAGRRWAGEERVLAYLFMVIVLSNYTV